MNEDGAHFAFVRTKGEAKALLKRVAREFDVTNLSDVKALISDMKIKRTTGK